jgi:type II secretory pathway predicted ATPase ExeA
MNLDNVVLSKIFNTRVDSEQLVAMINDDFGLPVKGKNKITLLRELNDFLIEQYTKGNKPVLIIDEAQNLSPELLEEIRMLSNLETDRAKLLQIILVGQPELRSTLGLPAMVQLRQRISINCHIRPLSRFETALYILHRLEMAGNRDAVSFPSETLDIIYRYSRGTPRLINIICDYLMISAFADDTKEITIAMVNEVIDDLDFNNNYWGSRPDINRIPERGGDGVTEVIGPAEMEYSALIRDISARLDNLDTNMGTADNSMLQEIATKLTTLENSLNGFKMETYAHIADLQKSLSEEEKGKKSEAPRNLPNKKAKTGFFRWVLGE